MLSFSNNIKIFFVQHLNELIIAKITLETVFFIPFNLFSH